MLKFARGGSIAAGSSARIFLICLLSNVGLSQTHVVVSEPDEKADPNSFLLQQIQEQYQTVLERIAEIQRGAETAFSVHRQHVATEIDLLKRDIASGRQADLGRMQRLHHDTRTVTLITSSIAVLVLMLNVVILFWGMNGIATRLGALFDVRLRNTDRMDMLSGSEKTWALDHPTQTRILQIIERLDRRLLELETKTVASDSTAAVNAKPKITPTRAISGAATGSSRAPRVSITLGEGSAIGFLPPSVGAMKLRAWWSRIQKWKRLGTRSRTP
jgi:hypothetical protein